MNKTPIQQAQEKFSIVPETYEYYMKLMSILENKVGVKIKVHGNEQLLQDGQIFLFNHFARFETTIPPYIIHKATGVYCRSIAYHGLFKVNDRLTNFLTDMGVVPNDQDSLLPFMAAEILRGRKVIIFPEGGLIKNRRVMNEHGEIGIFSKDQHEFRKHHRGAAALAMTLDLFKRRIISRFEVKDEVRINHWCAALGLKPEELFQAAKTPTMVVPSTITFYPIRIDDNIITKSIDLFMKKASPSFIEEMAIEGNILLKNTDMDIRLGKPLMPPSDWPMWKRYLLDRAFSNLHSLEDLFSLRKRAQGFTEKTLVNLINKDTNRLRDSYMEELYKGITVNLSHIASTVIHQLSDAGINQIEHAKFHQMLYLSIKKLQSEVDILLHRSIQNPNDYLSLLDGENTELERFLKTCHKAELINKGEHHYEFLPKLSEEQSVDEVRLENPLEVYANEVAPIAKVTQAVKNSIAESEEIIPQKLAELMWDDEIRSYEKSNNYYHREKFAQINAKEGEKTSGQPYFIRPDAHKNTGTLLIHGFSASPAELKNLANKLAQQGYPVLGVRLAGHGTSPWDLQEQNWEDWHHSAQRGLKILSAYVDNVITIGFSTGGVLSLMLAAEQHKQISAVISISAPLALRNHGMKFINWLNRLNKITNAITGNGGIVPFYERIPSNRQINYHVIPVHALSELKKLMAIARDELEDVTQPALIMQGRDDDTISPKSAEEIHAAIKSPNKKLKWIDTNRHGIVYEEIGNTHKTIIDFVKEVSHG